MTDPRFATTDEWSRRWADFANRLEGEDRLGSADRNSLMDLAHAAATAAYEHGRAAGSLSAGPPPDLRENLYKALAHDRDEDTGDVWLHREDADRLHRFLGSLSAGPLDERLAALAAVPHTIVPYSITDNEWGERIGRCARCDLPIWESGDYRGNRWRHGTRLGSGATSDGDS